MAKRKEKEALEAERKAAIKEKEAQVGSSYYQHWPGANPFFAMGAQRGQELLDLYDSNLHARRRECNCSLAIISLENS